MGTARRFAATLGMIAFLIVVVTGAVQGARLEWVLLKALTALVLFTIVGFAAGLIGAGIMQEAADDRLADRVRGDLEKIEADRKRREAEQKAEEEEDARREAARLAATSPRGTE